MRAADQEASAQCRSLVEYLLPPKICPEWSDGTGGRVPGVCSPGTMSHIPVDRCCIGPVRLNRDNREIVGFDEMPGDGCPCPVEFRGTVARFTEQNDTSIGEAIEQPSKRRIVKIGKGSAMSAIMLAEGETVMEVLQNDDAASRFLRSILVLRSVVRTRPRDVLRPKVCLTVPGDFQKCLAPLCSSGYRVSMVPK
jgi:hypothetical protein